MNKEGAEMDQKAFEGFKQHSKRVFIGLKRFCTVCNQRYTND